MLLEVHLLPGLGAGIGRIGLVGLLVERGDLAIVEARRIIAECEAIDVGKRYSALLQASFDCPHREYAHGVLLADETLFLDEGDDASILNQAGRRIVAVQITDYICGHFLSGCIRDQGVP